MIHKRDLKEGAILPIYLDYKGHKDFQGMARLIKEVDSTVFDKTYSSYISSESTPQKIGRHYKGGRIAIKEKPGWEIKEIAKAGVERLILTDGTTIDKPFRVRDMLSQSYNYLLEHDNYKKAWSVFYDCIGSTVFCPASEMFAGERVSDCKEKITLQKPYNYRIDPPESIVKVHKVARWLVEYLTPAFKSNIQKGKKYYYKDKGLAKVSYTDKNEVMFTHPISGKKLIGTYSDFYVLSDNMKRGHAYISYHAKNCKNVEEREVVYEREIDDFWEQPEE